MKRTGLQAYLTVYVSLSMAVLLSLFLAVFEGIRVNTLRLEAEIVTDIGMDSILAEYHRELFRQYGMFWIDTSYGSGQPSLEKTREHLLGYVEKNCEMDQVFLGNYLYRDFLKMETDHIVIEKAATAADQQGRFFRTRAIEVIKEEIGIGMLERVCDWLETVEKHQLGDSSLESRFDEVDSLISAYDGQEKQIGEEWVTLEVENPVILPKQAGHKGVLQLVIQDTQKLSEAAADLEVLISARKKRGEINRGNWEMEEGGEGRMLWQEYLMRYCGYYGETLQKGLLKYQVEYLIAGKDNDIDNLKNVVYRISAVREAANALYLFGNEAMCAQAEAAAAAIAAAFLIPEAEPLFRTAILLAWAYAESLYDVSCLMEGKKVPLLKTEETWHYGIGCIWESAQELIADRISSGQDKGHDESENGLSYEDYLRILLALGNLETQTFRMMDLVEMDIRLTPGNELFRLDGCIDRIRAEVLIKSAYGYQVHVKKSKFY